MRYYAGAILVAVTIGAAVRVATWPSSQLSSTSSKTVIAQPPTWVPFEADVLVTTPGVANVYGRYVRASDGSTRLESGPEHRRDRIVSIQNVGHRLTYVKGVRGWRAMPRRASAEEWSPSLFIFVEEMIGLTKLPGRIYVGKDSQLMTRAETDPPALGFEAYRYVNSKGDVSILVPSLNFFPILRQFATSGRREAFSNITLDVSPSPVLFEPDPGAVVAHAPTEVARPPEPMR